MLELNSLWLKKFLASMVLPPFVGLCLVVLGLLVVLKWRRLGLSLAWLGVILNVAWSQPATVAWLARPLETVRPLDMEELAKQALPDKPLAIVVLGGGLRHNALEYGGETLNAMSLERVRYAARLAKTTQLPVLVTGAGWRDVRPEAVHMKIALEEEFGVPVRWVENQARDTRENAEKAALMLKADGIRHVYVVTHAAHMKRAKRAFEQAGITVTPAPTVWVSAPSPLRSLNPFDYVPNGGGAYNGWMIAHEWLGGLAYRLSEK